MKPNDIIEQLLTNKKIQQKELAEAIGVSKSTLNNWLKLGRNIPAQYINPISKYLGVQPEYLLSGICLALSEDEAHFHYSEKLKSTSKIQLKVFKYFDRLNEEHKDLIISEMIRLHREEDEENKDEEYGKRIAR